jgi:hypothetical protein
MAPVAITTPLDLAINAVRAQGVTLAQVAAT